MEPSLNPVDALRSSFFGGIMYPAATRLRGEHGVMPKLRALQNVERQTAADVLALQQGMLADLLRTKLARVPRLSAFATLAKDVTAENAAGLLRSLPVLEKELLQSHPEQCIVEGYEGRYSTKTTGGSTGRPVTVRKNPDAIAQEMAATWLGYGWFGIKPGDPCIRFWGQPIRNLKRRLRYIAADVAMHRLTLSAFGYTDADLERYVRRIHAFRPRYLYGYVSALEDLARYMTERGVAGKMPFLRAVVTTSEVLSPPQRALIQRAFGVGVQNEYGCGELGPIAYECSAGSLHMLPTNQFVEILRPDGSASDRGEAGSVVITDLTNEAMPLIRYRVGDTASLGEPCTCGRPFPTLENVFGREYDFVEDAAGRRYHGEFFMYLFEDLRGAYPEIGQFQVVQTDADALTVRLQLSNVAGDTPAAVERRMRERLEGFRVEAVVVDTIQRRPSGKMLVVENRWSARTRTPPPSNPVGA
jgi:phenylacetate-CoA ligase